MVIQTLPHNLERLEVGEQTTLIFDLLPSGHLVAKVECLGPGLDDPNSFRVRLLEVLPQSDRGQTLTGNIWEVQPSELRSLK